jgi:hypothetical protein
MQPFNRNAARSGDAQKNSPIILGVSAPFE